MHPSNEVTLENVDTVFTYHNDPARVPAYDALRNKAKEFAIVILNTVPKSADRSTAMRHLRQALMNANAGVALSPEWPPVISE